MRLTDDAIPTTFTRLDESVVAADRFVDVRTQQQLRINHNALCGGGHMRPVFADEMYGSSFGATAASFHWIPSDGWPDAAERGTYTTLYNQDVYISPFVRKLKLTADLAATHSEWEAYAGVFTRGTESRDLTNFTVAAGAASYSVDLTMPHQTRDFSGMQRVVFYLGASPVAPTASEILAGVQPVAVGTVNPYSVKVTSASLGAVIILAGDVMYFKGAGPGYAVQSVEPRIIQGIVDDGAGNTEFFARDTMPWVDSPPSTSMNLEADRVGNLKVTSVHLYEYAPTGNFSDMEQGL